MEFVIHFHCIKNNYQYGAVQKSYHSPEGGGEGQPQVQGLTQWGEGWGIPGSRGSKGAQA